MANTSNASDAPLPGSAPPVLKTAIASWTMAVRAVAELWGLAAITTVLLALHGAMFPHPLDVESVDALPAAVFITAFRVVIALPLTIAVFRYAMLHEIPTAAGLGIARLRVPGVLRLAQFAVLYDGAMSLLIGLLNPLTSNDLHVAASAVVVLTVAVIAFGLWAAMYMPALAVNAPHATLANSLHDAKGHLPTIFLIAVLVFVPMITAFVFVGWITRTPDTAANASFAASLGPAIAKGALDTINTALSAAMASYIYVAFADRLGRPANIVLLPPT